MDLQTRLIRIANELGTTSRIAKKEPSLEEMVDEAVLIVRDADELLRKFIKELGIRKGKTSQQKEVTITKTDVEASRLNKAMNVVEDAVKKSPGRGRHSGFSWKKWKVERPSTASRYTSLDVITSLEGEFSTAKVHIYVGHNFPAYTPRSEIYVARYFEFTPRMSFYKHRKCTRLLEDRLY